jgi:hypothetical protein
MLLHFDFCLLTGLEEFIPWRIWPAHLDSCDPDNFTGFSNIFCADAILDLRRGTCTENETYNFLQL